MSVFISNSTRGNSRKLEILRAQTHLLYGNVEVAALISILAAGFLSALQWQVIPHSTILGWFAAMSAVAVCRYISARRYKRVSAEGTKVETWRVAAAVGAGLAGAGWGAAGILLYPAFDLVHQVVLVFVVGGMMLGAATMLAPRPEAFLAFLIPAGLGPSFRLLFQGDAMHTSMGLLTLTFTASTVISTWRIYLTIEKSIRLKFENQDLLQDLQYAIDRAEGLNETLEIKVQERTAELQESTGQLQAEMARREQVTRELLRTQEALLNSEKLSVTARVAATMAHEINNPLAAITNLIFLLAPLQTDPEARAYVATLEQQVKGLSRIATQMLKFHRDSNKPAEYSLSATLCEALDFHRVQAAKKEVTIRQSIETEGTMVGYKGEIVQVITNLLINALEATSPGGRIRVHLFPAPVWSHEVHDRHGYCVSIADNGKGINPQHRARIFEPFFTTKGDKGTGLGLWVCRGIISRAGGTMRVRSTQRTGRSGTCVLMFIPAETPSSEKHGRRRYEVA